MGSTVLQNVHVPDIRKYQIITSIETDHDAVLRRPESLIS